MNYEETLKYIHSLGMFSYKAGLERITAVLNALGNPEDCFDAVHIAGTNGKGSTAAFISNIFKAQGLKTALFISPFIIDFTERIQINGEFIPKERLCELTERVIATKLPLTEFEFITAVAFLYFAQEKCDIAVIETGLGGRFDATNTLTRKKVSVITKIGLDHTAILGESLSLIAAEKCGIIKGEKTVTSPFQPSDASKVIKKTAKTLILPDTSQIATVKCSAVSNEFYYKGTIYKTVLGGEHQIENALIAIEAVLASGLVNNISVIQQGLKNARLPARLEVFGDIILDGAHNPDGAEALERAMLEYSGQITAIIGMMRDKSVDEFLKKLMPHCKRVITVKASDSPRALTAYKLAEAVQKYCTDVTLCESLAQAVTLARKKCENGKIFIFGSLYLASAVRPLLLDI